MTHLFIKIHLRRHGLPIQPDSPTQPRAANRKSVLSVTPSKPLTQDTEPTFGTYKIKEKQQAEEKLEEEEKQEQCDEKHYKENSITNSTPDEAGSTIHDEL